MRKIGLKMGPVRQIGQSGGIEKNSLLFLKIMLMTHMTVTTVI